MSQALAVENGAVAFGGLLAVRDLSVEFASGRITGLIGPNGSGKSTLVNMMSGAITPSRGRVRLGDQDITALAPERIVGKGLARTYQIPRVPPELTVAEIISVPLVFVTGDRDLLGLADETAIARFCGLEDLMNRRCGDLSVPALRRLEIARALACRPSVLLLDEVMAGLSHEDTLQVVGLVRAIRNAGVTIVIIEHVMHVIADLCAWVVVLNNGSLLASGTPREVLSNPLVREAYLGTGFKL